MAEAIERWVGFFPYNIYPHHFFVRPTLTQSFDAFDKRKVVAYVFRRESSCLSWQDGKLAKKIISTAEFRIDLPHE
jgi:hypothetical protein